MRWTREGCSATVAWVTAEEIIERLGLVAHPEGGFYRETYRAADEIAASGLPARYPGPRAASTAIYFLLPQGAFSALHRIRSDELWHFYIGSPLEVICLHPDGSRSDLRLGHDLARGELPQGVVPAGAWFGARLAGPGAFALVGCTVAPGFDFADFELAERDALTALYPEHAGIIAQLTRP